MDEDNMLEYVEYDIYSEDGVEEMFDDDSLSANEYGFMVGYNAA